MSNLHKNPENNNPMNRSEIIQQLEDLLFHYIDRGEIDSANKLMEKITEDYDDSYFSSLELARTSIEKIVVASSLKSG